MSALRFPWGVEGYLSPREGEALYALACAIPGDRCVVELGAYKGRSTICLAQSGRRVISVDHFEGERLKPNPVVHKDHIAGSYRAAFEANVAAWLAEEQRPDVCAASTADASIPRAVYLAHGDIGLLFIDADHSIEGVRADVDNWLPMLARDGVVVFHDGAMRGPAEALKKLKDAGWVVVHHVESLRALQRAEVTEGVLV